MSFVGSWNGHGRMLHVATSGVGTIEYRVYKWCNDDPTPPCDEIQGNQIIDGGRIAFQINNAYSAGSAIIAQGEILSSTDTTIRLGPVTLRLYQGLLSTTVFPDAPFCSPSRDNQGVCGS